MNGKRGLLPRSVVEVVEDYVGSAEYTFVDAPNAPREDDPYVENKTPEKEPDTVVQLRSSETNEVKAVEFATDDMRGVLDLSITSTVPEKAGGIAAGEMVLFGSPVVGHELAGYLLLETKDCIFCFLKNAAELVWSLPVQLDLLQAINGINSSAVCT